ncbi:hypothetical protein AG1IA_03226 [Rhizoctonia solani AG-1 IA]|uniref:Uncharacterized protein n=1 Tax=Thanatephorus cucumeris (strain AG1-IA) TaxID=983506 RepID=L8X2A4_THACA|nr:hypothetical protein AG1IA_03226 [Rhizoctonia solani AG-1 IA]
MSIKWLADLGKGVNQSYLIEIIWTRILIVLISGSFAREFTAYIPLGYPCPVPKHYSSESLQLWLSTDKPEYPLNRVGGERCGGIAITTDTVSALDGTGRHGHNAMVEVARVSCGEIDIRWA